MDQHKTTNPWMEGRNQRPRHRSEVWQFARRLCLEVYRITSHFPDEEKYGLTAQLRRGVISIASNPVEGAARKTTKSYLYFLYTARSSLEELDAQLELAGDLGFLTAIDVSKARELRRGLTGILQSLINSLESKMRPAG